MSSNPTDALPRLMMIEALAKQLRMDVENGKLWPGEYNSRVAAIREAASQLPEGARR